MSFCGSGQPFPTADRCLDTQLRNRVPLEIPASGQERNRQSKLSLCPQARKASCNNLTDQPPQDIQMWLCHPRAPPEKAHRIRKCVLGIPRTAFFGSRFGHPGPRRRCCSGAFVTQSPRDGRAGAYDPNRPDVPRRPQRRLRHSGCRDRFA